MKHLNIIVDVEATGPCPGLYSMIEVGAVEFKTRATFFGRLAPLSNTKSVPQALKAIGATEEQIAEYPMATTTMEDFYAWCRSLKDHPEDRLVFWSDNPAFDWQFVNYYFHLFIGENPFGFSARRIGDLYAGAVGEHTHHTRWKKLRKTPHTHNALDDAMGNTEALEQIFEIVRKNRRES